MNQQKSSTAYRLAAELDPLGGVESEAANELRRLHKISERYQELLYAVESKYPGESRHDTVLRYIRDRECHKIGGLGATAKVTA